MGNLNRNKPILSPPSKGAGGINRYARHISLPEIGKEGQEKLQNVKVLVIGAGGLGCPVLQYLTAAGVGGIGIIDGDVVEESNLQRQILFSTEDVGKPKAETAAKKLKALNPYIKIYPYHERLSAENALKIIADYDLVIDGSDNFETRYLVNDACVTLDKPFVYGSIYQFEGQVSVFNYENGPTYRCLFPEPPEDMLNCSEAGVLGVLPGVIGCLQANEAIKIITGTGEVLSGKLLTFNCLNLQQNIFNITKNEFVIRQIKALGGDLSRIDYTQYCTTKTTTMAKPVREITVDELKKKQESKEDFLLIDVREEWEYDEKNMGGKLIPLGELEAHVGEIPKDKPVIIHCKSGTRSAMAVKQLQDKHDYDNLFNLKGGILEWEKRKGE